MVLKERLWKWEHVHRRNKNADNEDSVGDNADVMGDEKCDDDDDDDPHHHNNGSW